MEPNSNNQKDLGQSPELYGYPGHLIRRLHQINVGIFHEMLSEYNVTPVQFAFLQRLTELEQIDQRSLGMQIGVNAATISDVTLRLEKRGLLVRTESEQDRRAKLLSITPEGRDFIKSVKPRVQAMQKVLLGPLDKQEQEEFVRLSFKIIEANNNFSRAPIAKLVTNMVGEK